MSALDQNGRLRVSLHAASRLLVDVEARVIREQIAAVRSDHGVLWGLYDDGPLSVSEVGRKLHLTSGAVTTAIDRVERRGWVFRRRRPGDRRMVTVDLTPAGRTVFERVDPELQTRLGDLFSGLNEVERAQLALLLEKVTTGGENSDRRVQIGQNSPNPT